MTPWPHQTRGVEQTLAAIARGQRRVCVTSPTGGGKTYMAQELIRRWTAEGHRVMLLTNRRLLLEQTSGVLEAAGVDHGIRAAGHAPDDAFPVQLAMLQTEHARRGKWSECRPDRLLVDECHLQTSPAAQNLMRGVVEAGGAYVGLSATPVDLAHLYDELVVAGTNSELRRCGALVLATHYGPDEPDLRCLKRLKMGAPTPGADLPENQQRKLMGQVEGGEADERLHALCGRVLEWFVRINPTGRPTILFGPGVAESIWFAEQFTAAGISAAHIDGENVWRDGRLIARRRDRDGRDPVAAELMEASKRGEVKVLCNRFVLREGIDCPWLAHVIFATVFGSLQSYLQSGGRLLRAHPGLEAVTVQDHGGNWWRHGSLNADRSWDLGRAGTIYAALRENQLREHPEQQPVRCPKCGMVRIWVAPACPKCGYRLPRSAVSRPVVQLDGTLKELRGEVYKPRRIYGAPDGVRLWVQMYCRAKSAKWDATFRQAEGLFAREHHAWPDRSWPLMPIEERDWVRKVRDVPVDRLTSVPESWHARQGTGGGLFDA